MAVRCSGCGRLTRDETVCEWCQAEVVPAPRPAAAPETVEGGEGQGADAAPSGAAVARAPTGAVETAAKSRADEEAPAAAEERSPAGPWYRDNFTLALLLLILLQFVLTLYLGRLSSWWSVTGVLWLLVGYGVVERLSWSLALPLVLFTLDVAFLLFGIGPRERAGFFSVGPMDFCLYLLRLGIWAMVWSLRDELD